MQPGTYLQQERHGKVVQLLQLASSERDVTQRVKLLLQSQELLLKADTYPETVATCLEFFLNLQADPSAPLRRFAAYFLERLLLSKPSLCLRCTLAIAALLADSDLLVKELALKAAAVHHSRALHAISKEQDPSEGQQLAEQLRRLQEKARVLLYSDHPVLLAAASGWAQMVILSQTPAPLLWHVQRVPMELRGVSCIQDLPSHVTRGSAFIDTVVLQQQAEQLYELLLQLLQQSISGYNDAGKAKAPFLMRVLGSVARQRPAMLAPAVDIFKKILQQRKDVLGDQSFAEVQNLVTEEVQVLLASQLTSEWHLELMELLDSLQRKGSLEDLTTQAKIKQICSVEGPEAADSARAQKRARKAEPKQVWTSPGDALSAEAIYDADAILSGEAEATCKRLEEYFGLPSQREPAGHVPAPALLATRINSQAELARIALTSLSSLSLQRSLHRDRAHEFAVSFSEGAGLGADAAEEAEASADFVALLMEGKRKEEKDAPTAAEEEKTRDPRAAAGQVLAEGASKRGEAIKTPEEEIHLLEMDASKLQLPRGKDALQLRLFEEVLESNRRMDHSLMKHGFLPAQLESYQQMSRQVSLHLAAGYRTAAHADLQRSMCQTYVLRAFDALKASLQAGDKGTATMDHLVELFYAKFATDVARWQESDQRVPLREILEGSASSRRLAAGDFTYVELFDMCLAEFDKRDVPRREFRTFLGELPAVPFSAFRALEAQCQLPGARKMALLTILALIEGKPACRWRGLNLLLKLAFSAGEDVVRFDTIRLIINKIYAAPSAPMRWQLPHLSDAEAHRLLPPEDANGTAWELVDPDFLPIDRLRGRCIEDLATLMLRSAASAKSSFRHAIGIPLRLEQLRADLFKGAICAPKDRVWLYGALCIKRPILLHGLVETFHQCDEEMKEHLINSIEEAVKYIPVTEQELLVLVQKASRQTEALILKVLNILMSSRGNEPLQPGFGEAVLKLYKESHDPRLLVPVFDLLDRNSLLDYLPAVLQLEQDKVADAFRLIVGSRAPPISVTELLMELHHVNSGENIVPIKASMQALNIIFSMREKFDAKVYGIVIQSLVEEPGPLPTLFMRTVIQVVKELPRLSDFIVMEILPRLVRQEVWGDENMWRGFMIVLQHTFASQPSGAARVLAMLPMSQLEDVLVQHPDWKAQLREYVARQAPGTIMPHVKQLLE
ncbi:Symplekin [Durusdinium trenchii]|uniref:Symplekin n=1 Tax=Durusdinium trenchii TaxID=1381693 RepID=A0ABP0ICF9_9DINO